MHEVKSTLGRLEPLIVSIHAQMPYLATKAELERVRADLEIKIEAVRGSLEARIEAVRGSLEARIEAVQGSLETKIETVRGSLETKIETVRGSLEAKIEGVRGEVQAGLAGKPGYGAMWSMAIALFALVVAAIAAGAAYLPLLAHSLHTTP
jgi:hypothetical protein